ncbi:hypothetical protein C2E23DRAFT_719228 [Lenzites betulinus]|nr:hypothetical protein C2E23DRAFT_719228 [Lenzites betulinus]
MIIYAVSLTFVALLVYEYIITFDQEVNLFWRRKSTGATILFLTTRYMGLISDAIMGAATCFTMSDQVCAMVVKIQSVLSISQYVLWAAFSGLRTLALSGMKWPLALLVFVLSLGPLGTNLVRIFSVVYRSICVDN